MAAWTRIHGSDKHEAGRKGQAAVRPADGDGLVLHRLAHHFQHAAIELRQLVEEEHAAMRQADFAGSRPVAPQQGRHCCTCEHKITLSTIITLHQNPQ
jgi:hypothetical protein